ncbi:MAG: hypothetical protein QNK20_04100 [Aureibaculum sp.]|nr:hypothetical protein [Aureibaculum sp.]
MKFKSLLLFLGFLTSLTSCMFTEELTVNNDGSGTYAFKMDMSQMMESMKDMSNKDSLKEPEVLDTIVLFKDILEEKKDSISKLSKDEQNLLNGLEDLKLHMQVDEENGKMLMDFVMDFKNIAELKDMQNKISKAQALSDGKNQDNSLKSKADVEYSFDGKTFRRSVIMKELSEEKLQEVDKSIQQSSSFLEGTMYKIIYHFENEIEDVSFNGAVLSKDQKTVTIEVPLDSVMKNPKWLDFEIKLKQ